MSVHQSTYRAVLSRVPTSVAVVTALGGSGPCGMTIGSLGRLSLDPPLVLFCVTRTARSHAPLCAADRYCVSILAHTQTAVAERFARHDPDRFRHGMSVYHGLPAVAGAAAWLLCARRELVPAGDHTLVIGEVEHAEHGSNAPLVYHYRSYQTLVPVADPGLPRPVPRRPTRRSESPHREGGVDRAYPPPALDRQRYHQYDDQYRELPGRQQQPDRDAGQRAG